MPVVRIRILIGTTVVRIRILIGTTVVRIASVDIDISEIPLSESRNYTLVRYYRTIGPLVKNYHVIPQF